MAPHWWLEAEQVKVGGQYEFDMAKVGAVGLADVLSIDECPQPPRRQNDHHRLVTGKFEHQATNVIDLYVEGQDDPIGTTANHPFWSADRQQFAEAESLRPGENLLNAEGQRVRVITHSPRPGPQTVYNLEVDGEHVYSVTAQGLLFHNVRAAKQVQLVRIQLPCELSHGILLIHNHPAEHEQRILRINHRQVVVARFVEEENLQADAPK